jgi:hypothetical protein
MFGRSISVNTGVLFRMWLGAVLALVLLATPGLSKSSEAQVVKCSPEAREGLARVGAWAAAECGAQVLSFARIGSADPVILELLSRTGGWAADSYVRERLP